MANEISKLITPDGVSHDVRDANANKAIYHGQVNSSSPDGKNDFNNLLVSSGNDNRIAVYWCQVSGMLNAPESSGYGYLECISTLQRYTNYSTKNIFLRTYVNSTWSAWVQSATPDISGKINRSGDVMTGALVALAFTASANGSPTIVSQSTDVDVSKADNNISSDRYPAWVASDKYGRILTRMECVASSNGNIAAYWHVRNYDTSGSQVAQKGIKIAMAKDGSITYTIDDNSKFRTALGLDSIIDGKVSKSGDTMTGTLKVDGTKGGSWVSSKDVNQASISVNDQATNGQRYDSIIAEKCYNNGVISIGRITNELHIGYVESGRTANSLAKSMCFNPTSDKVSFQSDGAEKCKITISTGSFDGKWNGITDDHNTNNTTDTWVPVFTGNTMQHRVIPRTIDGSSQVSYTRVNANVSNDAKCWRFGNVVVFTGYFSVGVSNLAKGTQLWNGFPQPKCDTYFHARCEGNRTSYDFYINVNGVICTNQANIPAGTYLVNVIWIC